MTRKLLAVASLLCLLVFYRPATGRDNGESEKGETTTVGDSLGGSWTIVSIEFMGQKINPPNAGAMTLTFEKGKVTMKDGMRNEAGSYKIDESKKVKEIDLTTPKNGNAQMAETIKGIYVIEGDNLKIAFSIQGPMGTRPSGFDAKDAGVITLKRKR
jgi:uncharacterized protein (TIGR03067 family)